MKKHSALLIAVLTAVITLVLPFIGGSGPSLVSNTSAAAAQSGLPPFASAPSAAAAVAPISPAGIAEPVAATAQTIATTDTEHLAQKPVPKPVPVPVVVAPSHPGTATSTAPSTTAKRRAAAAATGGGCPAGVGGGTAGAPSRRSAGGVAGTTSADLASFAATYNAIRVANCLTPVPMANIRYDSCMETRLFWMAEDPSTDPMSAWGHMGSVRSDGVPSVGCDGNLAGGSGNSGSTVATKWWESLAHRASLYRPNVTGSTAHVCILFAMTHGGVPNEPYGFTRAAARWVAC